MQNLIDLHIIRDLIKYSFKSVIRRQRLLLLFLRYCYSNLDGIRTHIACFREQKCQIDCEKKIIWKKMMKENHWTTSLEILLKRNLKLKRATLKNSNTGKTNERLDKLCQEIADLTASLEFIFQKIQEELQPWS